MSKWDKKNLIFWGIFTLFFGFLLITGEPFYSNDTFQYENQMVMREPVYALLIQFLRWISPEHHYWLIIILQNILAVVTNTAVITYMRKQFSLNLVISFLFTAILIVPHILTSVFASSHLVLTNTLMTEGVLFSLYPLALICLLEAWKEGEPFGKKSIGTLLFFWGVSLIRGQMMVLFVVWIIAMGVLVLIQNWKNVRQILCKGLLLIGILLLIVLTRTAFVRVYNYCENGLFVDTASGKAMSFANVLYVADRGDGEAIEDEALRELFYEMYDTADADRMNYKYAEGGVLARAAYHESCHDELNFTYFAEPAKRYVGETKGIYVERYQELMIEIDQVASELSAQLMPQVLGRYAANYLVVIALGFVRSVAYEHVLLAWYSLFIYLAAIVLTVILWRKNPKSIPAVFMAIMLLTIVGNVCATALMIQCISRYMIYNLPLFYMAGILELCELYQIRKQKNSGLEGGQDNGI